MKAFSAIYYDGRSTMGLEILIQCDDQGELHLEGEGFSARHAFAHVRFSTRLGDTPRYLYLPDGGKCESPANEEIDALINIFSARRGGAWLYLLESRWSWVLSATVFTLAFFGASYEFGLPYLAKQTAYALPMVIEFNLGKQSLQSLDGVYMNPTRLSESQREQVRKLFHELTARLNLPLQPRLELRRSTQLGANAFALPSGIVIVTDALVELAENDDQLVTVLAHELGHIEQRHVMRSILQNSAAALLMASLLGDLTSITGLAASIPTFLIQQRYSRDFEREADRFAVRYLEQAGIPLNNFTTMLENLNREHSGGQDQRSSYLSSHPATRERIEALRRHESN